MFNHFQNILNHLVINPSTFFSTWPKCLILEDIFLKRKSKTLSEVLWKPFAIPFYSHFVKIISNHLNIPTNHFILHKPFFMLKKSFHFAKNPKSFSTLGLVTSRLDYCINSIWEYTNSSLLLRPLSFICSFQRISQLFITM